MATFQENHDAAGARYVAAVIELRAAYVSLAAFDRKADKQGFGNPPEIVSLRHSRYLPNLAGAMTDGIAEALSALG